MQSAKVDSLEVDSALSPPPSGLRPRRRLPGLLAFFPDTGRHYAYNRAAFVLSQDVDPIGRSRSSTNATMKLSCAQRLTPKQQRRLDKRRAQERELQQEQQVSPHTTATPASTLHTTVTQVAQTIRFVDCLPQEQHWHPNQPTACSASTCRGDDDIDATTGAATDATPLPLPPQAPPPPPPPPPRLHTNDVICLALLDIQHQQAYSRRLLSRIVSLCQPKEPTTSSSLLPQDNVRTEAAAAPGVVDNSNTGTGNNDDDTKRRIHCWILLQSSVPSSAMPSMDLVDEWLQHSGVTLLVFDDTSNDSNAIDNLDPASIVSTDRDHAVDNDCLAAETLDATAQTTTTTMNVAASSSNNRSAALLPPVPFSSWLWTALAIHQCPSITILDVATGRRLATHQEQVLLQDFGQDNDDNDNHDSGNDKWTREEASRIREAWLDRRTTAATTAIAISNALCNVQ